MQESCDWRLRQGEMIAASNSPVNEEKAQLHPPQSKSGGQLRFHGRLGPAQLTLGVKYRHRPGADVPHRDIAVRLR